MCFGNTELCKPNLPQLNSLTRYVLASELQLKFGVGCTSVLRMGRRQVYLGSVALTLVYADAFGVLSETIKGERVS